MTLPACLTTQAMGNLTTAPVLDPMAVKTRGMLSTPYLDKFSQVAADCQRARDLDRILTNIARLSPMPPDEVAEILRALELAEDGTCSVSLQQAREDAESQARVNV